MKKTQMRRVCYEKLDSRNDLLFTSRYATRDDLARENVSDYALAWSKVATEAANEALRRRQMMGHDTSGCTITSIGKGSSASDAILERDQQLLWKQGYAKLNDDAGSSIGNNHGTLGIVSNATGRPKNRAMSIAEQAAAVALLKRQNRNQDDKHREHQGGENTKRTSVNERSSRKDKTTTARSTTLGDFIPIDSIEKGERFLVLANHANDDKSSKIGEISGLIEIEATTQPRNVFDADHDCFDNFVVGQIKDEDKLSRDGAKEANCEFRLNKHLDSDGDTSSTGSSRHDIACATTSATRRVLVALALTFGHISAKLKSIRWKIRSDARTGGRKRTASF